MTDHQHGMWPTRSHESLFVSMCVVLIATFLPVISCSGGEEKIFRDSKVLMGTVVQIAVSGGSESESRAAIAAALAEIERIDGEVSSFREQSRIAVLNREGYGSKIPLGKSIFDLLRQAVTISEESGGAFDVTIWPVSRLWGFDKGGAKPDAEKLAEAVRKVGYKNLLLHDADYSVGFSHAAMGLDLGAIAKGWAVDRATEVLMARGVRNAIVDAGGDLRVVGSRPGKGFWRVGVQDPRDPGALLFTFDLTDTAIVTSGDYERFFEEGGVRYHHILDPATGMPAAGCRSVTVLAPTAAEADAAATAAFVLGAQRGIEFLRSRPGVGGVIVDAGGSLHWTDADLERMARRTP